MANGRCTRCGGITSQTAPCKRCERLNLTPNEPSRTNKPRKHRAIQEQIAFMADFQPPPSQEQS